MHTFGIRLLYPGTIGLVQSYFHKLLIRGRAKLVEDENGIRFKVKTIDNNDLDTMFIDNRARATSETQKNGQILVICSEGNGGFYEIGIMATPLKLKYSVLGWNRPGFAGSTVSGPQKWQVFSYHQESLRVFLNILY